MTRVAVIFFFCALVAALLGFTNFAGGPLAMAKVDAVVFAATGLGCIGWRLRRVHWLAD